MAILSGLTISGGGITIAGGGAVITSKKAIFGYGSTGFVEYSMTNLQIQ